MQNSLEQNLKYVSQSIQRTIDILLAFTPDHPEWGVTELSEALDLPKSAVYRVVVNLEMRGFLEQDPVTDKYRLGLKLFELGMRVWRQMDLKQIAQPYLEEISAETGEGSVLSIVSDDEVVYVGKADGHKTVRAMYLVGERRPIHCTAVGRALLAWMPREEVTRIIDQRGLPKCTPKTVTDPDEFIEELSKIRQQGYAIDVEGFEEGLCGIAAPILGSEGKILASIGIAIPKGHFDTAPIPEWTELTKSAAEAISRKMGYSETSVDS